MKIFAFIMAVTVLVLSCLPCMDGAYAFDNSKAKIVISEHQHQQQHNDTDDCSPFCTCNCCAGFAFVSASYQIGLIIKPLVEKNAIQLPAAISEISLPVWQPPQLS